MDFAFGRTQYLMSRRLGRYPQPDKLVYQLFGHTNVGAYARADVFRRLLKKLPLREFKDILDLGCGWGEYSFMLAQALPASNVTALDINRANVKRIGAIAQKSKIANLHTHAGDLASLPSGIRFDFIFSIDVFEHIEEQTMPFGEAYRRLRPGGFLLVKIPNRVQRSILPARWFEDHQQWLEDEHVGQVYELHDLAERMEREGFLPVDAFYADGWCSRLGWELGYLARRAGAIPHLCVLPLAKSLVWLDRRIHGKRWGNTIQVIGQKAVLPPRPELETLGLSVLAG